MKKITIALLLCTAAVFLRAEEENDPDLSVDLVTGRPIRTPKPGSKGAANREHALMLTGGHIMRPGSQKGKVLVLDAQVEPFYTNMVQLCRIYSAMTKFKFDYIKADPSEVSAGDYAALMKKHCGSALLAFVQDDRTPSLLVAPDDRWAIVNVNRLTRGLKGDETIRKFTRARIKKQFARAVSLMSGVHSNFKNSPLAVNKLEDLDLVGAVIPQDEMGRVRDFLTGIGLSPAQVVTYRVACIEGWAPKPTNKYQESVWKLVHAMPTEPFKIKPETKKVSE